MNSIRMIQGIIKPRLSCAHEPAIYTYAVLNTKPKVHYLVHAGVVGFEDLSPVRQELGAGAYARDGLDAKASVHVICITKGVSRL